MSSIDDLTMRPSRIELYGSDLAELLRAQQSMTPSRGNKKGGPTRYYKLMGRKWFVHDITWKGGGIPIIYKIVLNSVMEVNNGGKY